MIRKHKLLRVLAFILVYSFVLNILPVNLISVYSYADQNCVFEDNRFLKEDGTKYIRIMDVTEAGARVIIYETDPDIAFMPYYQPEESAIISDWNYAFEEVPEDFSDPDIAECIDEMLIFYDNEGSVKQYLAPDGKTLYVRDSTGDFISFTTGITGTYRYLPYITEEIVETDYDEIERIPVDPATLGEDWRNKVDLTRVGTICVDGPSRIVKIGEKNFDEKYWETSLKKLAECSFIRFMGVAWVDEANIKNDKEYRDFHLNRRLPGKDSEYCKNSDDEDIVIETRRGVFLRQEGKNTGEAELLYYYDSEGEKGFMGLFVENGSSDSEAFSVSWGDGSVGYYFDNIDWYEMNNKKSGSWSVTVDEETNTILLEGEAEPTMHHTGGIAYHLSYNIWIYFNDDGTIDAEGYVTADGEGTEELIYGIKAGAVEFQNNSLYEKTDKLIKKRYTYDVMQEIPGDSEVIPVYEATVTRIVQVKDIQKIAHYNDWPDDTDPVDPNERRTADEYTIYGYDPGYGEYTEEDISDSYGGYDYDKDAGQYIDREDLGADGPDMSIVRMMDDFKYSGAFMAVDATENSGSYLVLSESGYAMLLTTIQDENGYNTIFDGYYDYAYTKDADGIYDLAVIRLAFPEADEGHTFAEALYSEQFDMVFFLTPGFGEMGKDEFWEGNFVRTDWE